MTRHLIIALVAAIPIGQLLTFASVGIWYALVGRRQQRSDGDEGGE